jgi:hypothetical protein
MQSFKKIVFALSLLSCISKLNANLLVCPANNLGYGLYANENEIKITYNGDVIKTWLDPSRDWDGHMSGIYVAHNPDLISIYYANHYGINRKVSVHCRINYNGMEHYNNFFWPECNNINHDH